MTAAHPPPAGGENVQDRNKDLYSKQHWEVMPRGVRLAKL